MRKIAMAALLGAAAGLAAYGVSPNRAEQGQAQNPNHFQLQPNPMPSNNLAPGQPGFPPPQGAPLNMQPQPTMDFNAYKPDPQYSAWEHVHLEDAKRLNQDPGNLFVDARAKVEYDQGHIPGAICIPSGEFDKYYEKYKSKIQKAKKLISYCHGAGCKLSEKTAEQLYKNKGHKNVAVFFGGWPQWQQNNLPVETGPEPKR